ncbi:hypothetical protein EB796_023164 [Bugula neritina]|uniref:Ecto-NOX disulfide-thiol exchanger 1/2 domain-containing protein n=1 Tax=Bugula neritina TaxID=10212 RepID=A0A7J7IXE7_BUGNE|nr:hypothetical protein EB796_023164 [Bugula neritina]
MYVSKYFSKVEQIQNVFSKARQQKVWDHFSKPQRKNLELWTSQCQELKQKHDDELLAERKEDEMDLSDSESTVPAAKKLKLTVEAASNMNKLSDENDSLKCQLEAYKNELDMNKMDAQTEKAQKSKQIAMLQQTLKGMQQQLMSTRNEVTAVQQKYSKLLSESGATETAAHEENKNSEENGEHEATDQKTKEEDVGIVAGEEETTSVVKAEPLVAAPDVAVKEEEGKLLGLVVCFLNVHPFGASVDSIVSYLKLGGISVDTNHVTSLLDSFPNIFFPKISGLGVDFEKLWTFNGFSPIEKT